MLLIEVKKSDKEIVEKLIAQKDKVQVVEPSNLDGEAIMQLFIRITEITAPIIAGIIVTYINSNKIIIKKDGINITMTFSKRNLKKAELIKELMNMQKEDKEDD